MLDDFTQREIDVLSLLASGQSNREIARDLALSIETVRWYNKQIYSKLGVHRRSDAVRKAQTLGFGAKGENRVAAIHNLPESVRSFIGRQKELEDVRNLLLDSGHRFITLVGPGGMGKTRLALAVAEQLVGISFRHGVFFVPLQPLTSPEDIISTIGQNISYQFQQDNRSPKQQIIDYLKDKHILLILDNFEHLLDEANLISEIITSCPRLTVLVTSRERLNLYGETIYSILGLQHQHKPNQIKNQSSHTEAFQLFVESVRKLRPGWRPEAVDNSAINDICIRLEGMPLAIELAAGWITVLTVQEIAGEITSGMDFLRTQLRDVPQRHRSIQAVFDHSWRLISETERKLFMKVSLFQGGFTKQAAEKVADASIDLLVSLVNKSFIQSHSQSGRYQVHELLRQYGREKLTEHPALREVCKDLHSQFFAEFLAQQWFPLRSPKQKATLQAIQTDFENIRIAWLRAIETAHFENVRKMMNCLWYFLFLANQYEPGVRLFDHEIHTIASKDVEEREAINSILCGAKAYSLAIIGQQSLAKFIAQAALQNLRQTPHSEDRLLPLIGYAQATVTMGEYDDSNRIAQEGLDILDAHGEEWFKIGFLVYLGLGAIAKSKFAEGTHYMNQCLAIAERYGDPFCRGLALRTLGGLAFASGDYEVAEQYLQRTIPLIQESGQAYMLAFTRRSLGWVYLLLKQYNKAKFQLSRSISLDLQDGLIWSVLEALRDIAEIFYAEGKQTRAVAFMILILNHPIPSNQLKHDIEEILTRWQTEMPIETYELGREQGMRLDLESATQALLDELGDAIM